LSTLFPLRSHIFNETKRFEEVLIVVADHDENISSSNTGLIVGLVVGFLVLVGAVVAILLFLRDREPTQTLDSVSSEGGPDLEFVNETMMTTSEVVTYSENLTFEGENADWLVGIPSSLPSSVTLTM
jgi:hypothetical protein